MKYRVDYHCNNEYSVIEIQYKDDKYTHPMDSGYEPPDELYVFQGSLSDCESYIRLHEGGYINNSRGVL